MNHDPEHGNAATVTSTCKLAKTKSTAPRTRHVGTIHLLLFRRVYKRLKYLGDARWCSNLFVDIFIQTISMQLTSVFRGISAPIRVKFDTNGEQ